MDEQITIRKITEDDGEHITWFLVVGSEPVVAIRTSDTLPKAKAIEYLFAELVGKGQ